MFNEKDEVIGIVGGSIGVWDYSMGEYPRELGVDGHNPSKTANKLAAALDLNQWLLELLSKYNH